MALGEHIFIYCGSYSHHGIDMGDGTVIHYDSTPWRKLSGAPVEGEDDARIARVALDEFAKERPVYRREYRLCYANDLVAHRALSRLGERGYRLFNNNCEHFAVWCKTGQAHSTQIESIFRSAYATAHGVPMALACLRLARRSTGRTRLVMYGAAATITVGSGLARYVRHRINDIQRGVS